MSKHSTLTDPALHEIKGAATATSGQVPIATGLGTAVFGSIPGLGSGSIVKSINTQVLSTSTGTTLIPFDNTIPQNVEGTQFMSASWTPSSTANKIRVEVSLFGSYSAAAQLSMALFQDATANALAAVASKINTANDTIELFLIYEYPAPTTTLTTFYVRVGGSAAGTVTLNGNAGTGLFGGVAVSSITITEVKP